MYVNTLDTVHSPKAMNSYFIINTLKSVATELYFRASMSEVQLVYSTPLRSGGPVKWFCCTCVRVCSCVSCDMIDSLYTPALHIHRCSHSCVCVGHSHLLLRTYETVIIIDRMRGADRIGSVLNFSFQLLNPLIKFWPSSFTAITCIILKLDRFCNWSRI